MKTPHLKLKYGEILIYIFIVPIDYSVQVCPPAVMSLFAES